MRGFGLLGALGFLILVLIAGAIGFGLGANTVPATVPAAGAPVVYYGHVGWGGFGFFGFFLFIILIFAVIGIFRRAAWGGRHGYGKHGYGWYGRGWYGSDASGMTDKSGKPSWGGRPVPPFADEMLQRWHREAHGEPTPADQADKADSQPNQPSSQG